MITVSPPHSSGEGLARTAVAWQFDVSAFFVDLVEGNHNPDTGFAAKRMASIVWGLIPSSAATTDDHEIC